MSRRKPPMHSVTRRRLLATTAGLAAAAAIPGLVQGQAQTPAPPAGPFRRDPLPYPPNAQQPIPDVLAKLNDVPEAVRTMVRNKLGGHANHAMFWQIMGSGGGRPSGAV